MKIADEVAMYLSRIPSLVKVEGSNRLEKMINSTKRIDQQKDYLISFLIASLYGEHVERIVFEEKVSKVPSSGPHDLVVYFNDKTRVINEIHRLKQTKWDKYEEDNLVIDSIKKTGLLYELRDDPIRTTTGFFDTILNEIESKGHQFESNEINILWIASKGIHYKATDIEDAAYYYLSAYHEISNSRNAQNHRMPENLTAIGWVWDGDPNNTTAKAQCFFLRHSAIIDTLKKIFVVKKIFSE